MRKQSIISFFFRHPHENEDPGIIYINSAGVYPRENEGGNDRKHSLGFTLAELIIIISIFVTLLGTITINLYKAQNVSSIDNTISSLVSDIKSQQLKAMTGDTDHSASAASFGIYFQSVSYILFKGNSYNPSDSDNLTISLDSNLSFNPVNFPNNIIVFTQLSGEISGFTTGQNTITLKSTSGSQKTITINRYGVVSGVN